jgi:hypothetical protein
LLACAVMVAVVVAVSEAIFVAAVSSPLERSLVSQAAAQAQRTWYRAVMVPAGTVFRLRLDNAIRSDISRVEDPVQAHLDRPVVIAGEVGIPVGSVVLGTVTDIRRASGLTGRAHVAMGFDNLSIGRDGYAISTEMVGRADRSAPQRDAIDIVVPVTAGTLIGDPIGGERGAAIGGTLGAVAGAGYVLSAPGSDVGVSPGNLVWVRLAEPLWIRVRST